MVSPVNSAILGFEITPFPPPYIAPVIVGVPPNVIFEFPITIALYVFEVKLFPLPAPYIFPLIVGEPLIVILLSPNNAPPSFGVVASVSFSEYAYPPP